MAVILIADDNVLIRDVLTKALTLRRYEIIAAESGNAALDLLRERHVDLLLSEVVMTPLDGLELLKKAKEQYPRLQVVLITAFGSVSTAAAAMALGAFDYIPKPIQIDDLVNVIEHALNAVSVGTSEKDRPLPAPISCRLGTVIAESPEMQLVCQNVELAAITSGPSLLCGEAGTGKSLIARTIHACSARKNGEFVVLNCAEMPEPVVELLLFGASSEVARRQALPTAEIAGQLTGKDCTILLEEVTMMPPGLMDRLILRMAKGVDRRSGDEPSSQPSLILSAAATTLKALSRMSGCAALVNQISGVTIVIKPLRERQADVLPMLSHFFYKQTGNWEQLPVLAPDAYSALIQHPWPGNHAELAELVDDLLPQVKDGWITKDMLPSDMTESAKEDTPAEDTAIRHVDHRCKFLKKFLQDRLSKKGGSAGMNGNGNTQA